MAMRPAYSPDAPELGCSDMASKPVMTHSCCARSLFAVTTVPDATCHMPRQRVVMSRLKPQGSGITVSSSHMPRQGARHVTVRPCRMPRCNVVFPRNGGR